MTDIVIRGGHVVDGTGAPARRADVAIEGDRITAIGEGLEGAKILDATDQIVAPGFIDIHTHYDAQVFWDPALTPSCFHGVTTVVAGNCGFSVAPTRAHHREAIARTLENVEDMNLDTLRAGIPWDFESFGECLGSVARRGTLLNYGGYLGHSALRLFVMGDAGYERDATDAEIEEMCTVVRQGLEAGAVGFSSSFGATQVGIDGKPVPSRFSDRREFDALSRVLGEVGKGVLCVIPGGPLAIEDLYRMQPALGRPIVWGPLLTWPEGASNPFSDYREIAAFHRRYRDEGVEVWAQVTPRLLTFQYTMANPFPLMGSRGIGDLIGKTDEVRTERFRDARWRREVQEQIDQLPMRPRWDATTVDESEKHPELLGRSIADLVSERGGSPLDLLCELSVDRRAGYPVPPGRRERRCRRGGLAAQSRGMRPRALGCRRSRWTALRCSPAHGSARQLGPRAAGDVDRKRGAQAHGRARRDLWLPAIGVSCGRAPMPTSPYSTRPRWHPVRLDEFGIFQRTPIGSLQTSPLVSRTSS